MAEEHWSQIEEASNTAWELRFMLWVTIHLPRKLVELIVAIVVFFFYLGAAPVRKRSRLFLEHVSKMRGERIPSYSCVRPFDD